jgi:hypothetical protein
MADGHYYLITQGSCMQNSSWYRQGLVTVTTDSDRVEANETHWDSSFNPAAPKIGDIFSLDGITLYEILAIANDHLILDRQYDGPTLIDTNYCIIRVSSHSSMTEVLSQVTHVFNLQKRTVDELGTWATIEKTTAPITDPLGVIHHVATPYAMDKFTGDITEIEHLVDEAESHSTTAGVHSSDASLASQSASINEANCETYAQESADNADKLATVAADLVKTQHIVAALHPLY